MSNDEDKNVNAVTKLFSDDSGNFSSMRIVFFLVVINILICYDYVVFTKGILPVMDWGAYAAFASMFGAKAYQKKVETDAFLGGQSTTITTTSVQTPPGAASVVEAAKKVGDDFSKLIK